MCFPGQYESPTLTDRIGAEIWLVESSKRWAPSKHWI